jgi:hypothetical protein
VVHLFVLARLSSNLTSIVMLIISAYVVLQLLVLARLRSNLLGIINKHNGSYCCEWMLSWNGASQVTERIATVERKSVSIEREMVALLRLWEAALAPCTNTRFIFTILAVVLLSKWSCICYSSQRWVRLHYLMI